MSPSLIWISSWFQIQKLTTGETSEWVYSSDKTLAALQSRSTDFFKFSIADLLNYYWSTMTMLQVSIRLSTKLLLNMSLFQAPNTPTWKALFLLQYCSGKSWAVAFLWMLFRCQWPSSRILRPCFNRTFRNRSNPWRPRLEPPSFWTCGSVGTEGGPLTGGGSMVSVPDCCSQPIRVCETLNPKLLPMPHHPMSYIVLTTKGWTPQARRPQLTYWRKSQVC